MPSPAFIVEGRTEQLVIQHMCRGQPVVLIGCNGDNVTASTMARFIDVQARILKRYDPKIVLCDREGRDSSPEIFANQLQIELSNRKSPGQFIFGISDREFENWIIAGMPSNFTCDFFNMKKTQFLEGSYGKTQVSKGMLKQRYQATVHGPELFRNCSARQMSANSSSAKVFIEQISGICSWAGS